jgi:hypothetical protein
MFKALDPDPHSEAGSGFRRQIECGSVSATLLLGNQNIEYLQTKIIFEF